MIARRRRFRKARVSFGFVAMKRIHAPSFGIENMNKWKLWTGRLLLVSGSFLLLAIVPIFFPVTLMNTIHGWLGLGEMAQTPIVIYLARSTSILYAVHGAVMVYTGLKIERLWPMVMLLGVLHVAIGLTLIGVDINAGLPLYWILGCLLYTSPSPRD